MRRLFFLAGLLAFVLPLSASNGTRGALSRAATDGVFASTTLPKSLVDNELNQEENFVTEEAYQAEFDRVTKPAMAYLYGARYLDPRTSVWVSTDPALGKFIPSGQQTNKDQGLFPFLSEHKGDIFNPLQELPGHGGVYKSPNLASYTYTQQNPVNLTDPDGEFTITIYASKRGVSSNDMQRIERTVGASRELVAASATAAVIGSLDYVSDMLSVVGALKQGVKGAVIIGAKEMAKAGTSDRLLSKGEAKKFGELLRKEDKSMNIEKLKKAGGKAAGEVDLFVQKGTGNIIIKPKDGKGAGEVTGYNLKEINLKD